MKKEWHQAIRDADLLSIRALASQPNVLNSLDRYGQTALMLAAKAGQTELVKLLVELGAELDHRAKYNLSAAMLAAINGHSSVVRALKDAGADLSSLGAGAPGFYNKTAFDLAVDAGRQDVIEVLRD